MPVYAQQLADEIEQRQDEIREEIALLTYLRSLLIAMFTTTTVRGG